MPIARCTPRSKYEPCSGHDRPAAIGVATGVAYCGVHGYDFRRQSTIVGTPMILASRLSQQARVGEVLADEVMLRALRSKHVTFTDRTSRQLKGLGNSIVSYRVEPSGGELVDAVAVPRPTVGRHNELEQL